MPQIAISQTFFKKERGQAYANWRTAWWREIFANVLDAGATRVTIQHSPGKLSVLDNGSGMSRQCATEVYLTLGRSSKDEDSTGVGGFGRARVLTCFSMEAYTIRSQDYIIEGSGDSYDLTDSADFLPGFYLEIRDTADNLDDMKIALSVVLRQSCLPNLEIFYNDEIMASSGPLLVPAKCLPLSNYGHLMLAEIEGCAWESVVRVNGLAMFETYQGQTQKTLLVELDPVKSRELLTANRDGPKPLLSSAIVGVAQAIAAEGDDAAKPKLVTFHRKIKGTKGLRQARSRMSALVETLGLTGSQPVSQNQKAGTIKNYFNAVSVSPGVLDNPLNYFTMTFSVETTSELQWREGLAWDPELWMRKPTSTPSVRPKWRLLAVWETACEIAIQTIMDFARTDKTVTWAVGLAVGNFEARLSTIDRTFFFELCPLKADGKELYNLAEPKTLRRLLANALHEACHTIERAHDSRFACLLTDLAAELEWDQALKTMRETSRQFR